MVERQKVCAITGGSSGIGSDMAVYFARQGWAVAFTYVGNLAGAEKTADAIREAGGTAFYSCCDVGYSDQVEQFLAATVATLGVPQLWVNNAGVQTWAPFLELEEESWDRTIRTNLKGSFICTQRYARLLVEQGLSGSVVNVGSGCNKHPFPRLVDYSASKGGIEMLTRVAATELGEYGIRVNCVAPGAIEIERTRQEAPEYAQTWARQAPLGRVGNPDDVAAAIAYFASDAASFVTGQTVYVDGGAFTAPNWPDEAYD